MKAVPVFRSEAGKKAILAISDQVLAQWPVPYESLFVPTRHGNTFVIASGNESHPPLALVHGSSSNAAMWIGDVAQLCEHYRVYAIDIPGESGKSEEIRREDILLHSLQTVKRTQRLLPQIETVLLPEAGHVLLDQTDAIVTFLLQDTGNGRKDL